MHWKLNLRRLRRFFTVDGYARAPAWLQVLTLVAACAILVLTFAVFWGSIEKSYLVFIDPPAFADAEGWFLVVIGFVELVLGITLAGFLISVLTAALEEAIHDLRTGSLPFKRGGHLLIVNRNRKLVHVLEEIEIGMSDVDRIQDIVILLKSKEEVEHFFDDIDPRRFQHLSLYVRSGPTSNFETYERLSIFKALGVIVLLDQELEDAYEADNRNLMILMTIMNNETYSSFLVERTRSHDPQKCAVELHGTIRSREVAAEVTTRDGYRLFALVQPNHVIGRVLSRSIVDMAYYRMHREVFSFAGYEIYFVDPRHLAPPGALAEMSFKELSMGLTQGVLLGFSWPETQIFRVSLFPFDADSDGENPLLCEDGWPIILARDERSITFDPTRANWTPDSSPSMTLQQPSEFMHRRICMLGEHRDTVEVRDHFLDDESKLVFERNIIVETNLEDYFHLALIDRLRDGNFDSVVINLPDSLALRLAIFFKSHLDADDPLLGCLITILDDPVCDALLCGQLSCNTVIQAERLAGSYITQIAYQKNLSQVFDTLLCTAGGELNLLEIGVDIPKEALADRDAVKRLLLQNDMALAGVVGRGGEVRFDAADFADAQSLVVLSGGKE